MIDTPQKRAPPNHRRRLAKRGMARFAAASGSPTNGGILAALRRSPQVGADLNLARSRDTGRKVDL